MSKVEIAMPVVSRRLTLEQNEMLVRHIPVARRVAEKLAERGKRRPQSVEAAESDAIFALAKAVADGTVLNEALAWTIAERGCRSTARENRALKRQFVKQYPAKLDGDEDDPLAEHPDHRPCEIGRRELPLKVAAIMNQGQRVLIAL